MSEEEELNSLAASQSLTLCVLFSSISGLLRVVATMVLAYPDFLERQRGSSFGSKTLYISAHLFILAIAAFLSIIGTIYGPVSIAVPVTTGTCLLSNVVAMGIVLRMRAFNKAQRTGTYVVFFSVLSLIDVGPGVQDNQNALKLLSTLPAVLWSVLVTALMVIAGIGTVALVREGSSEGSPSSFTAFVKQNATLILATGTTTSNVGMATASKTFASLQGLAFDVAILYYSLATFLGVLFSVVSSTACDQGIFTPVSSVALIITNMITGIIVWEDWKVLDTWIAYVCAMLLMCCGVYLLAEVDIVEKFWRRAMADVVLPAELRSDESSPLEGEVSTYGNVNTIEDLAVEIMGESAVGSWQAAFSPMRERSNTNS